VTIEAVVFGRLSTYAGLTALVSTRVYPAVAPQNATIPFLTYRRISAIRQSGMGEDIGIVAARFQLDAIASAYTTMRSVMTQARLAMQRWRDGSSSPEVLDTYIQNEIDLYEDETDLHHGVLDVLVHHRE
jgi:hypothetical protein